LAHAASRALRCLSSRDWAANEAMSKLVGNEHASRKLGCRKIEYARKQAVRDGLDYLWVDTHELHRKKQLSRVVRSHKLDVCLVPRGDCLQCLSHERHKPSGNEYLISLA